MDKTINMKGTFIVLGSIFSIGFVLGLMASKIWWC